MAEARQWKNVVEVYKADLAKLNSYKGAKATPSKSPNPKGVKSIKSGVSSLVIVEEEKQKTASKPSQSILSHPHYCNIFSEHHKPLLFNQIEQSLQCAFTPPNLLNQPK